MGLKRKGVFIHLSKTKIKQGFQCEKQLYLQTYHPTLARDYTVMEKNLFKQGGEVQAEARKLFKGGLLIDVPYWEFAIAKSQTQQAIQKTYPSIYEGVFISSEKLVARIDVLERTDNGWNAIEIKSSTTLKKDHLLDIAIQQYVLKQCDFKINRYFLIHLNKECFYPDLHHLFCKIDVTESIEALQIEVQNKVQKLMDVLNKKNHIPEIQIGPYCHKPYPCRFISQCWKHIPTPSVFDIPSIGEQAWNLYQQKKVQLSDVPDSDILPRQQHYKKVHLENTPYINQQNIKKEISTWKWPLYYLDFETISPAIPRFNGTRPFQHIPFQWSVLMARSLEDHQTQSFKNSYYLHSDLSDPRELLSTQLAKSIGEKGSVVAYYKEFESLRLKELAKMFPEHKETLLSIESRLVDPLPLLRENVCFKEFKSSWSMKSVAPVLLGSQWSYSHLAVQDGLMAQMQFEKMCQLNSNHPLKEKIKKDLLKYCHQDTLCLALIVKWLFDQIN